MASYCLILSVRQGNPYADLDKPLGILEVEAPRICRQMTNKGGKVVNRTHRPPLPPKRYPWYSFLLEAELTSGLQCGNISEKRCN
jgi:hypothetical protein